VRIEFLSQSGTSSIPAPESAAPGTAMPATGFAPAGTD
jgi:hypothetical protein